MLPPNHGVLTLVDGQRRDVLIGAALSRKTGCAGFSLGGLRVQLGFARRSLGAARAGALIGASLAAIMCVGAASPAAAYEQGWGLWSNPVIPAEPLPKATVAKHPALSKRKLMREALGAKSKEPEKLPAGPLQIVISLRKQELTLYANGEPVAHSVVSTGVPGHSTPLGVFSVIQKQIYHESNIYSSAPMPYMQRITWSGVAMHQGVVPGHPASHGCIRMPAAFAQRLWRITKVGVRVIIAQDDVSFTDIASTRLFTPKPVEVSDAMMAPAEKVRLATAGDVSDAPLKGTIDGNVSDEARIERAIDEAVAAGLADAATSSPGDKSGRDAPQKDALSESPKDPMLRPGPISVFISRKQGMLYVRKGFMPVFEAPVSIAQPDESLGTHVFTALGTKDDGGLRWNVASLATERVVKSGRYVTTRTDRGEKLRKELVAPIREVIPPGDPNAALERISIPPATLDRIIELMTPGASLIISDLGPSYETGNGTDFIVLTR